MDFYHMKIHLITKLNKLVCRACTLPTAQLINSFVKMWEDNRRVIPVTNSSLLLVSLGTTDISTKASFHSNETGLTSMCFLGREALFGFYLNYFWENCEFKRKPQMQDNNMQLNVSTISISTTSTSVKIYIFKRNCNWQPNTNSNITAGKITAFKSIFNIFIFWFYKIKSAFCLYYFHIFSASQTRCTKIIFVYKSV